MIKIMLRASTSTEPSPSEDSALIGFDKALVAGARVLQRPAGTVLFRAGQRPTWVYYIRRGEAVMLRVTASGTPVLLQRANQSFLAEASLTSARYHCDGVCRTACEMLAFKLSALRDAIDNNEETRWAWIGLLSSQARYMRTRVERQALRTIRERLQHLLATEGTDNRYKLPATKVELAIELGVAPAALYRCLAALKAEGTLREDGKTLSWCA